jgi:hypothetical protein
MRGALGLWPNGGLRRGLVGSGENPSQYPFTAGTPEGGAIGEAHNNGRPELMKTMGHFLFSLFRWGIEEDHCVVRKLGFGLFCKIKHDIRFSLATST